MARTRASFAKVTARLIHGDRRSKIPVKLSPFRLRAPRSFYIPRSTAADGKIGRSASLTRGNGGSGDIRKFPQ